MPYADNIQEILNRLHQDVIGQEVDYPHRIIREGYKVRKFIVNSHEEAFDELTHYYQYHYAAWLKTGPVMPYDLAYSNMRTVIEQAQGGYVQIIKNCISGRDGGLLEAINLIAEAFRKEAVEKYVGYIVGTYIDPLDYDYKIRLMRQYLDQYGRYLLPGERTMSVYELAANCEQIIKFHANAICSFRKLLQ